VKNLYPNDMQIDGYSEKGGDKEYTLKFGGSTSWKLPLGRPRRWSGMKN
jgi:hypothetical protein